MLSYLYRMVNVFASEHKYQLISLSGSCILFMTTIQRYCRLKNEYDHYERRHKTLQTITSQKQDELENLVSHINRLLSLEKKRNVSLRKEKQCVYDHGDHPSVPSTVGLEELSTDEDEESEDDPLLQRLKLTKPTRLKLSSRQMFNNRDTTKDFTDTSILDEIHTVYGKYLSE